MLTSFQHDNYYFKNYIELTQEEKILVLTHRNRHRQWMIHDEEISLETHLIWIKSLEHDTTKVNFLVFKDDIPFIAIGYHDINPHEKSAYWGYFLINDSFRNEVLRIEKMIIDFAFSQLPIHTLLCINDVNNHVIAIHKFFGFQEKEKRIINNKEYSVLALSKGE